MVIKNKVILITGASEGIGRELALVCAKQGALVVAVARNNTLLQELVAQHKNITGYACDVRKPDAVAAMFAAVQTQFGNLHALINCAGIWQKVSPLTQIADDRIADLIATNLTGVITVTKYALPLLLQAPEAALINIVSKSGMVAQAGQSVYTATKFGVRGFTDVLRVDHKESNLHIMAVYQSGTDTEMFRKTGEQFDQEKFTSPQDLALAIVSLLAGPKKFWVPELHVNYA